MTNQILYEKALNSESKPASVLLEGSILIMRATQNKRTMTHVMTVARSKIVSQMKAV